MRAAAIFLLSLALCAQDVRYPPKDEQIPGPSTPSDWAEWLDDVRHWRDEKRVRIGYSGKEYERPELAWSQRDFIQPQMMVEERYFYDPVAGKYTVDQLPRRSRKALRRDRQRVDLAGVSECRNRQP